MLGAIIGAAASLAGNLFKSNQDSKNAADQNAHNARIAAEQNALARENMAQQKEFAQHGVRWKVADAQAAGLHPLAALGAQTNSFSNVVGASPYELKTSSTDFGSFGQDIGRAIDSGSTQSERQDRMGTAIARTAQLFSLEKLNLENEMLKSSIAKERATTPPPFPMPGNWVNMVSGGPERMDGLPIKGKDMEQQHSTVAPYKTMPFLGMNLAVPNWHAPGQAWEDVLGEGPASWIPAAAMAPAMALETMRRNQGKNNPFHKYRKRNSFNDRFYF